MNMKSTIALGKRTASFLSQIVPALFAVIFLASAAAAAEPPKVIAHLALPGTAVRQMVLRQHDGKQYLYLQQGAHFTLVDVTAPFVDNFLLSICHIASGNIFHTLRVWAMPSGPIAQRAV
jgi:hypothetical protein